MFEPAVVPLEAYRNGVLRTKFTISKDGSPLNLTGYEIEMQVRLKAADPILASAQTGSPSTDGSIITITSAPDGEFEVYLSNLDFQDIVFPSGYPPTDTLILNYDILFKNPANNDILPLIKGSFRVYTGITIHD